MIKKLVNSLKRMISPDKPAPPPRRSPVPSVKQSGARPTPKGDTKTTATSAKTRSLRANDMDSVESQGPGKNVLVKNRYIRDDTGTHETLKILDESLLEAAEEGGMDPYNTGAFDRSKNWASRTRK